MSVRISTSDESAETVVRVDGRLRSEDIRELHAECCEVRGRLVLDLSNLQSVDAAGLAILNQLEQEGAHLRGASPYIALLLQIQV